MRTIEHITEKHYGDDLFEIWKRIDDLLIKLQEEGHISAFRVPKFDDIHEVIQNCINDGMDQD
jgi:hypothetical protein